MSKRRISLLLMSVMSVAVLSVFAAKALAVPETGTFVILTYDPTTGQNVGNVPITVRQLKHDSDRVPAFFGETNDFGVLYHAAPSGTYRISTAGGIGAIAYLGSGGNDRIVTLEMN